MKIKMIVVFGVLSLSLSVSNSFANIVTVWNGTQVSGTVEPKKASVFRITPLHAGSIIWNED